MTRFNLLFTLFAIGILAIYQFLPIGDYRIGMVNGLAFLGLLILYILVFIYETYLNLIEKKYEKKRFDRSASYITFGLIILFIISQNLNIFNSKTVLNAKTEKTERYELTLRNNGKYELIGYFSDYDCHYQGNYKWNKDTLELDGKGEIDSKYYWNKNHGNLIPLNDHFEKFIVKKTSP